ncbi:nitroreductase family deazaflavin-dependent oxidoreductase [Amycolatopsis sp. K13G38]|uniref:Nitroreductase family deazaflavin-dependent oxidoreductase n=1 Tax=Amycolatopsis acididurans TaxID=2724524 RepID=A0ABX1JAB2_9PSEU|nr:nitroreductase family deazaflavin-dependent oxidoreductase [Amycolatopsis acididurans]NKQ55839.1 nitroreductase family deazaflavin-dependent oxidoreductase [Amycolatopsis acididurans]
MAKTPITAPPRWLKLVNRLVIGLQKLGLPLGTMRLLTVRGRKSGQPRTTPVSPLTVDGKRYVIGGFANGDWVANARANGDAVLARGRHRENIRLVELPPDERGPIMRAFPREVPHGVPMFVKAGIVENPTPDEFEKGAAKVVVFRIEAR